MLPGGAIATLLLLALIPGWLHLRLRERLRPARETTGLGELLEVVAIGLVTTGTSVLLVVMVPPSWMPFLLDVEVLANGGNDYVSENIRSVITSVVVVLLVAAAIAYVLYRLERHLGPRPPEFRAQGSVWTRALGERPAGTVPWVGLTLTDGRGVEGVLDSFTVGGGPDDRDIALTQPIRVTMLGGAPTHLELDRVVVPDRSVAYIGIVHVPERAR